jgi:hypothetical protein
MAALEPESEPDRVNDKIPWVRIAFGVAAIGFVAYCVYLGQALWFGAASIVIYSIVFACIISLIEWIWKSIRRHNPPALN